jgi:DNA mismatch repair protein MutS2
LKIQVLPSELQLMEDFVPKKEEKHKATGSVRLAAPSNYSTELDLRGQNGDEAVMELERFIDNAVRLHLETIRIIHGKGTGVLRQRVQACLKKHSQVKSYRLGIYGEGEDGVTIATLKK